MLNVETGHHLKGMFYEGVGRFHPAEERDQWGAFVNLQVGIF
jgi:hypothetical protein